MKFFRFDFWPSILQKLSGSNIQFLKQCQFDSKKYKAILKGPKKKERDIWWVTILTKETLYSIPLGEWVAFGMLPYHAILQLHHPIGPRALEAVAAILHDFRHGILVNFLVERKVFYYSQNICHFKVFFWDG